MNRNEARIRLAQRLGNRGDVTAALIDPWLNEALVELTTRRVEIQELQGTSNVITSQVGVTGYSRPADAFAVRYLEETTQDRLLDRFPGGFEDFLREKQNSTNAEPTRFGEWGNQILLLPPPDLATYSYTPYVYKLATWGSAAGDSPTIGTAWHRGILLLAEMIAFQDMGDDERASKAQQEFEVWLGQRDTSMRQMRRFNVPTRGVQPAGATMRDPRTGV